MTDISACAKPCLWSPNDYCGDDSHMLVFVRIKKEAGRKKLQGYITRRQAVACPSSETVYLATGHCVRKQLQGFHETIICLLLVTMGCFRDEENRLLNETSSWTVPATTNILHGLQTCLHYCAQAGKQYAGKHFEFLLRLCCVRRVSES